MIKIKNKILNKLFKNNMPVLVAEISANHNGSLAKAKRLINSAKKHGADLVKLQTYTPYTMTIKSNKKDFKITQGLWKGKTLWDLYSKAQTPFNWQKILFNYAKKKNIPCFSTPFDESALKVLEEINCPFYKISSFEMTDIPLIKQVAKTKKPVIISTGLASLQEIETTISKARQYGIRDLIILYCVSSYPAKLKDFNLNNIKILMKKFNCIVGLSDHSKDNLVAQTAVALGAQVIEKHIALDNQVKGFDLDFSIRGKEIREFKNSLVNTWKLLGQKYFKRSKNEKYNMKFRRSIYIVKNIKKGEKFSKINLRRIRPGYGLPPIFYDKIIGKKALKNLNSGTPLKLKYVK